ncbi:helix-turn-helix domain-containing protein [Asticcacaulis benevestitus]|uniref:HTH cro/C1-type domain-containing protein n=1 Tax=Asticcacaulis benevestitus DSM 16100 = ATCC BAA-896 TaxID=1121022 RepID=V4PHW7_9CAUL|nr:helix-turn-helix transcriptional regulator [Asticcacaulis benevestitus]ESQ87776.1 hypothetical protein ABENE_17035 [Asticcacaulis benevestitus DSM 16100 = ATCC BAA-896]
MSSNGLPHGVDVHVGMRIRQKRKDLGLSQSALATALDLTFQQVQKYERGTNRVSASKLHEIALTFNTPIGYFFAGYGDEVSAGPFIESASERTVNGFLTTREGLELAEWFPKVKNPKLRRRVVELAKTLADEPDEAI